MKSTIIFKRDNKNVKKPLHLKKWSVFIFYAARNLKIPSMQFERCNTEITLTLPKNSCGYFTSKFKTDENRTSLRQQTTNLYRNFKQISNRRSCD